MIIALEKNAVFETLTFFNDFIVSLLLPGGTRDGSVFKFKQTNKQKSHKIDKAPARKRKLLYESLTIENELWLL